jgi:hypothetical protein
VKLVSAAPGVDRAIQSVAVGLAIALHVAVTVTPDATVVGLTLNVAASASETKKIDTITAMAE